MILGGDADLARGYAEGGYETVTADIDDDLDDLIASLAAPVFLLAAPQGAVTAWSVAKVAAMSIVADSRISPCLGSNPAVPTIVHLDPRAHAELADAFEAAMPDLPVHLYPETPDGERLLRLRTLRLFSGVGGRGEV